MRTSIIVLTLFFSNLLASNELSWVDEQVQAIKPARHGINRHELSKITDPFIFLKKNRGEDDEEKKTEPTQKQISNIVNPQAMVTHTVASFHTKPIQKRGLTLEAILNKSVMINGRWYKLHENVRGYIISDISTNSVLLTKNKKSLLLTTKTRNTKIKFQR